MTTWNRHLIFLIKNERGNELTFREREGMKEGKRKKSTKRKEGGRVKEQEKRRKEKTKNMHLPHVYKGMLKSLDLRDKIIISIFLQSFHIL